MSSLTEAEEAVFRSGNTLLFSVAGFLILVSIVQILAGLRNYYYRWRLFGIAALILGLSIGISCECAPTALALAVYGLIVYLNKDVAAAFRLGRPPPVRPPNFHWPVNRD